MEDLSRKRFNKIDWADKVSDNDIVIVGAGAIGSYLAPILARVGTNTFHIFDKDEFSEENLAGQNISHDDIGKNKVDVVKDLITKQSRGNDVFTYNEFYTEESLVSNVMFSCVDSLEARAIIFENWYREFGNCKPNEAVFIDGRLGLEVSQMFCILPGTKELEEYRKVHLDKEGVSELPCTLKITPHVPMGVVDDMVTAYTNWSAFEPELRLIPSYISKDRLDIDFKVKYYGI